MVVQTRTHEWYRTPADIGSVRVRDGVFACRGVNLVQFCGAQGRIQNAWLWWESRV